MNLSEESKISIEDILRDGPWWWHTIQREYGRNGPDVAATADSWAEQILGWDREEQMMVATKLANELIPWLESKSLRERNSFDYVVGDALIFCGLRDYPGITVFRTSLFQLGCRASETALQDEFEGGRLGRIAIQDVMPGEAPPDSDWLDNPEDVPDGDIIRPDFLRGQVDIAGIIHSELGLGPPVSRDFVPSNGRALGECDRVLREQRSYWQETYRLRRDHTIDEPRYIPYVPQTLSVLIRRVRDETQRVNEALNDREQLESYIELLSWYVEDGLGLDEKEGDRLRSNIDDYRASVRADARSRLISRYRGRMLVIDAGKFAGDNLTRHARDKFRDKLRQICDDRLATLRSAYGIEWGSDRDPVRDLAAFAKVPKKLHPATLLAQDVLDIAKACCTPPAGGWSGSKTAWQEAVRSLTGMAPRKSRPTPGSNFKNRPHSLAEALAILFACCTALSNERHRGHERAESIDFPERKGASSMALPTNAALNHLSSEELQMLARIQREQGRRTRVRQYPVLSQHLISCDQCTFELRASLFGLEHPVAIPTLYTANVESTARGHQAEAVGDVDAPAQAGPSFANLYRDQRGRVIRAVARGAERLDQTVAAAAARFAAAWNVFLPTPVGQAWVTWSPVTIRTRGGASKESSTAKYSTPELAAQWYAEAQQRLAEGKLEDAYRLARNALSFFETAALVPQASGCALTVGQVSFASGRHAEAATFLERALQGFTSIRAEPDAAASMRVLAELRLLEGHWQEAVGLLETADEIFARLGNEQDSARCRLALGQLLLQQKNPGAAMTLFREAQQVLVRHGRIREAATCSYGLGRATLAADARDEGELIEALHQFEFALNSFEANGAFLEATACAYSSAEVLQRLHRPNAAARHADRAERLIARTGLPIEKVLSWDIPELELQIVARRLPDGGTRIELGANLRDEVRRGQLNQALRLAGTLAIGADELKTGDSGTERIRYPGWNVSLAFADGTTTNSIASDRRGRADFRDLPFDPEALAEAKVSVEPFTG